MSFLRQLFFAAGLSAGLLLAQPVSAQDEVVVVVIARWVTTALGDVLVIPFSDALTEKQKNMITGGFTTVSQLTVRMPGLNTGESPAGEVFNSRCTVKFDAWEETYEIVRVKDAEPKPVISREFKDYATSCLTGDVTDSIVVGKLAERGGLLQAQLMVKQTSADEALKIKEWLIQQQSGVMQSLFSHMLGDISLYQTHAVNIRVPPKPEAAIPATKKTPAKSKPKPGKG